MDENGVHTNNVECFFGEMRRAQAGAFHRMGLGYLRYYAAEMAWRLEMRDVSNRVRLEDLARRVLRSGRPGQFADVWNKREERVAKPEQKGVAFEIPKGSFATTKSKQKTAAKLREEAPRRERVSRNRPRTTPEGRLGNE